MRMWAGARVRHRIVHRTIVALRTPDCIEAQPMPAVCREQLRCPPSSNSMVRIAIAHESTCRRPAAGVRLRTAARTRGGDAPALCRPQTRPGRRRRICTSSGS